MIRKTKGTSKVTGKIKRNKIVEITKAFTLTKNKQRAKKKKKNTTKGMQNGIQNNRITNSIIYKYTKLLQNETKQITILI